MAENSEPSAYPAHYPLGGTFADFLCWHMDYWGTRRQGSTTVNGLPWGTTEFRREAFPRGWEVESNRVGLGQWRGAKTRPSKPVLAAIKRTLFGGNPVFQTWSADLDEAWMRSKGKDGNKRTKQFPNPPPIPTETRPFPRVTTHFIGRDGERESIVEAILAKRGKSQAFLIQGGPGMGKTELTKAIAHHAKIAEHFGDRRWFVRLETTSTAGALQDAIMRELKIDPQLGFQAALNGLRDKQSLIVLDNLETPWEKLEVRSATEDALAELSAVTGVSIIASFRGFDKIGGPFWYEQQLHGLAHCHAKELFASIAGKWVEADSEFESFINALGGIPLAIDLVARRAHGRASLASLWAEWSRVGAELAQHPDFDEERLTSLPRSIELSLRSVRATPEALRLFRLLGCMPAGLSAEDLAALMNDDAYRAEERLMALGLAVEQPGRMKLLPPIREFARRRHQPEASETRYLIRHFLKRADNWENEGRPSYSSDETLCNVINIESAFKMARSVDLTQEALGSLVGLTSIIKYERRALTVLEELSRDFLINKHIVAAAKCQLAMHDTLGWPMSTGRPDNFLNRAKELYELSDCISGIADCLRREAFDLQFSYKHNAAIKIYRHAIKLYDTDNNEIGTADCFFMLGIIYLRQEQFSEADTNLKSALEIFIDKGDDLSVGKCFLELGNVRREAWLYDEALDLYDDAFSTFQRIGDRYWSEKCLEPAHDCLHYLSRKGINDRSRGPARDAAREWSPTFRVGDR